MDKNIMSLFVDELKDLLSAEQQIIEALPEALEAAESPDLKKALKHHLQETREQVQRLEKIFEMLKIPPSGKTCKAMKGLIAECSEAIKEFPKSFLRDAALISKLQRIEHYEISAYGTVKTFAEELDMDDAADLLNQTQKEEVNADKKLSKIAEGGLLTSGVNQKANIR